MKSIESFLSKYQVKDSIVCKKTINGTHIDYDTDIKHKLKLKKNRPPFMSLNLELDDNFEIKLQTNPKSVFQTFSATLMKDKQWICRLDMHDSHRRKCKKEIGKYYDELHFHVYCDECLKQGLKNDAMVINIDETKIKDGKFECFMKAFFEMINIETRGFNCSAVLEYIE